MNLAARINTFGQDLKRRYGERVHKLALNAGLSCPNRDGTLGTGGCTFCNNHSFNPQGRQLPSISDQLAAGRAVIARRTGARRFIAYFQAYTNTHAALERLKPLYQEALTHADVVGLSIGTRPDCLPDAVLDLLADYRDRGYEIWIELGLQSSFDTTLQAIQRGHDFAAYVDAVKRIRARQLPLCTHLIVGLPGEGVAHNRTTLQRVLDLGVSGLKLHPLHVVRGTALANSWRRGEYQPLQQQAYVAAAVELIQATPPEVIFHRITATAAPSILLAPDWCSQKWRVLNAIAAALAPSGAVDNTPL